MFVVGVVGGVGVEALVVARIPVRAGGMSSVVVTGRVHSATGPRVGHPVVRGPLTCTDGPSWTRPRVVEGRGAETVDRIAAGAQVGVMPLVSSVGGFLLHSHACRLWRRVSAREMAVGGAGSSGRGPRPTEGLARWLVAWLRL